MVSLLQFKMVKKNTCIMFHVVFILLLYFVLFLSYSRHTAKSKNKINGAWFEVLTSVDEDANILRRNILSIGKHSEQHEVSTFSVRQSKIKCLHMHARAHAHTQKHYAALICQ